VQRISDLRLKLDGLNFKLNILNKKDKLNFVLNIFIFFALALWIPDEGDHSNPEFDMKLGKSSNELFPPKVELGLS
jgi:hypothetical protein